MSMYIKFFGKPPESQLMRKIITTEFARHLADGHKSLDNPTKP
jgi:hypothetical protein